MPYIFRRCRLSKKRIHTADDANAGNMKTRVSSKTAFPIQKEGSGDMIYCVPCRRKNGTAAPKIRSEDSFAAAMPSSLLEENVTINRATMTPCNVPPADSDKMSARERVLSPNTGSRAAVTRKEAAPGRQNLAAR